MRWAVFAILTLFFPTVANAQVTSNLTDPNYLAVNSTNVTFGGACGGGYCVGAAFGVPLNYFATSNSVSALSARLDAATAAFGPQIATLHNQVGALGNQIATLNNRISGAYDVAAVAGAMKDAIPNQGDRFAIRLNAAAIDGYSAGAYWSWFESYRQRTLGFKLWERSRTEYGQRWIQPVVSLIAQ